SYSKVRAITRVATPETEQDLIDFAMHSTAAQLERLVRTYRQLDALESGPTESRQRRAQERFVRKATVAGGMVRIEIQLPPEQAALVWDAVMSAASSRSPLNDADESRTEASAETLPRAPASDESEVDASAEAVAPDEREAEQRHADAIVDVARAYLEYRPRTLGSGYELVLVTSKQQLEADSGAAGGVGGFLRDGTPVPIYTARMLACCGSRVEVTVGEGGEVLDVGRRTRVIPSAIGRALWLRDHGCRVPGCERRWHLHAHHVVPWAEGGPTKLSNLVLVCPFHHGLIHEGVLGVELRDGQPRFGRLGLEAEPRELVEVPPSSWQDGELDAPEIWLDVEGRELTPEINMPRWDGSPMRLGEVVDWMLLAGKSSECRFQGQPGSTGLR
ncbi:MAG: DUF222 domain-containing protein, partial [Salinibacterium sp.]|nr:DUF222 domain-containing protein [Salinibacterium sp.]